MTIFDDLKNNTVEEVVNFWAPLHEKKQVEQNDIQGTFERGMYISAHSLRKNVAAFQMFFLMEGDYDTKKANEIMERIDRPTKLAEYLHLKFLNDENTKGVNFINLMMNFNKIEDNGVNKMKEVLDALKELGKIVKE